jgi:PEP-CTERM motif
VPTNIIARSVFTVLCLAALSTQATANVIITGPQGAGWFGGSFNGAPAPGITNTNPHNGNPTLEMHAGTPVAGASSYWIYETGGILGLWGQMSELRFDYFLDPLVNPTRPNANLAPPQIALRVGAAFNLPDTYFMTLTNATVDSPSGQWITINALGQLVFERDGLNTPTGTPSATTPVYGIHLRSSYGFDGQWTGYVDNFQVTFNQAEVPEPSTYALILSGLALTVALRRRR